MRTFGWAALALRLALTGVMAVALSAGPTSYGTARTSAQIEKTEGVERAVGTPAVETVPLHADLIVLNGKIATMDDRSTRPVIGTTAQALAVKGDAIIAIGTNEEISRFGGPQTRVLDVMGLTVIPGLIDSHWHWTPTARGRFGPSYGLAGATRTPVEATTAAELRAKLEAEVKKQAAELPAGKWILVQLRPNDLGEDFIFFDRQISEADLDGWAPNHAVFVNSCGRAGCPAAWAVLNSLAKRELTKLIPDLQQDELGYVRSGVYLDRILSDSIANQAKDVAAIEKADMDMMRSMVQTGTTSVGGWIISISELGALNNIDRRGEMPLRMMWIHGQLEYGSGFYKRYGDIAGQGTKYLWQGGVGGEATDLTSSGLCSTPPIIDPEHRAQMEKVEVCMLKRPEDMTPGALVAYPALRANVQDGLNNGLRIAQIHGQEATIDHFVDMVDEAVRVRGMTVQDVVDKRHTLEHNAMVRPDQYEKVKKYGIYMNVGTGYMGRGPQIQKWFGPDYVKWLVPAKSMMEAGVKVTVGEYSNWEGLRRLVTREIDGRVWVPEEAVDRVLALKMATTWNAEYLLREDVLGTLEVGKLADFLVLDRDYFTIPANDIAKIKPLIAAVGGRVAYESSEFSKASAWETQFELQHGRAPTVDDRADREWSLRFLAENGRPPTEAEWRKHHEETRR